MQLGLTSLTIYVKNVGVKIKMKIVLSKNDIENVTKNTGSALLSKIVNIVFKYTRPLEVQLETCKLNMQAQVEHNKIKNRLLDEIIYHDIGMYYNEKELLANPEEYIRSIKKEIRRKKDATLIVK